MASGGSAKALLVGLGLAAGVVTLLLAPVGPGEDRRTAGPPPGSPPASPTGSQPRGQAVIEVDRNAGPSAVQAYLDELGGRDPETLLRQGEALCRLWRTQPQAGGSPFAVAHADRGGDEPDLDAVTRAAGTHLCPRVAPPR
jgi:hypothetical protein